MSWTKDDVRDEMDEQEDEEEEVLWIDKKGKSWRARSAPGFSKNIP